LEDRAKQREIETIISTDLLEPLVLRCSIRVQRCTLRCTIHRHSSATLSLPPRPTSRLRCGHKEVRGASGSYAVLFANVFKNPLARTSTLCWYIYCAVR